MIGRPVLDARTGRPGFGVLDAIVDHLRFVFRNVTVQDVTDSMTEQARPM
jgi:hypothetical protein